MKKKGKISSTLFVAIALFVVLSMFLLVACNDDAIKDPPQTQDPPLVVQPGEETDTYPDADTDKDNDAHQYTFADFVKHDAAVSFVAYFSEQMFRNYNKDFVNSLGYYVEGHDYVVTHIHGLYIYYDVDSGKRKIQMADLKFHKELYVDDIVNDPTPSTSYRLSSIIIMEFDAQENELNKDLVASLYRAAGLTGQKLKVFQELENSQDGYRTFRLYSQQDDYVIQMLELTVESGETNEALISNLSSSEKVTIKNERTYLQNTAELALIDITSAT